jgi:hypothetical protein
MPLVFQVDMMVEPEKRERVELYLLHHGIPFQVADISAA